MSRIVSQSLAACAAMFIAFGSISAIVTVPPVQAMTVAPILA